MPEEFREAPVPIVVDDIRLERGTATLKRAREAINELDPHRDDIHLPIPVARDVVRTDSRALPTRSAKTFDPVEALLAGLGKRKNLVIRTSKRSELPGIDIEPDDPTDPNETVYVAFSGREHHQLRPSQMRIIQNALFPLEFGGKAGEIDITPDDLTNRETLERIEGDLAAGEPVILTRAKPPRKKPGPKPRQG